MKATHFVLPTDSFLFNPYQLQPRSAFWLAWNGIAAWFAEHVVPVPRLIADHQCGIVILSAGLQYHAQADFLETVKLHCTVEVALYDQGRRLEARVEIGDGSRDLASVKVILCAVRIAEMASLGAIPEALPDAILARFPAEQWLEAKPSRRLPALFGTVDAGRRLGVHTGSYRVNRHFSEAADQWSWTEAPSFCEANRNELLFAEVQREPLLARSGDTPVALFEVEFSRPLFSFDMVSLQTRAMEWDGKLGFVHEFHEQSGGGRPAGVAVEVIHGPL
jgi:acyl-CoA thioesterase FadM